MLWHERAPGREFCQEGSNENRAQGLGRQSGLPDVSSTVPKLTHPDHSSLGSQKACAISDSKFKAHDISLSSDLYVEWIRQRVTGRVSLQIPVHQNPHSESLVFVYLCKCAMYVCTHVPMGRAAEAVRCPLLLSASFPQDRSLLNLELTIFWLE